ncbi:MAG: FecR family protein, partial [Thermodesulfovibrionales bacterium]
MKIVKAILTVMCLVLLLPAYAFPAGSAYMRISYIAGDVQVNTPDAGDWGFASVNAPLGEGDQVWVPQGGRAELQLNSGTFIRLDQNSALQILSMDNGSSQFHLSQGSAYVVFDISKKGGIIQVDTPDASTRAYKRAIFRIDISDQYTDVAVYRGSVETENGVGRTKIRKDQMLSLGQDTDGEVAPMGPFDEWETWNKKRNDRIVAGKDGGTRYLPEELRSYSNDFDNNGKWVRVPDYGYVWTPTVIVGTDWAPYREGRWIWRHGEYVWVGHEPWGWVPYHYGRWDNVPGVGWCWVPPTKDEVYWGPGYVGWVRTAEYVAWVPLAPREIYYGHGNYGRHSVNIANVNINQVNITNVYKNINVTNGVTVINRNAFNTAAPAVVNVNRNDIQKKIFIKNNFITGASDIKPIKGSYFASPKSMAPAQLPPQLVRNVAVKDLKQARPFTKDAAKSVMNPGVNPAQLPVNTVAKPRTPGMDKPVMPPIKPTGTGTSVIPESSRTPRTGVRLTGQPADKDKATMQFGGPAVKDDKAGVKPERKATGPEVTPATRGIEPIKGQPADKDKGKAIMPFGGPA